MNFVEELRWRGMLHDIMPGTEELLNKGMVAGYIGFDPTADSLHVGSLAQIMTMIHFQRAGHKPFALVGGATGMVGDPSGKSAERNLLSEDVLQHNLNGIKKQLEKFLDFNSCANSAQMVNNYDWFKDFSFLNFIRDVGKHITVNYMMAKDSVKNRIGGDTGMSFTEFSYQLVQGYDFYYLWKHHNCALQMGGSDQWGNIVTGTEMIRRKDGGEAFALTTQLIKKADGTKFGKTESGAVWLDPARTSPYKFYQFWLNTADTDVYRFLKFFTFLPTAEIERLEEDDRNNGGSPRAQYVLAENVTRLVHGDAGLAAAVRITQSLFSGELRELTADDLAQLAQDGMPSIALDAGADLQQALVDAALVPSRGQARTLIGSNAIAVNGVKQAAAEYVFNEGDRLFERYTLLRRGKKNYCLICWK